MLAFSGPNVTEERFLGGKLDSRPGGVEEYDFSDVSVAASNGGPCCCPWCAGLFVVVLRGRSDRLDGCPSSSHAVASFTSPLRGGGDPASLPGVEVARPTPVKEGSHKTFHFGSDRVWGVRNKKEKEGVLLPSARSAMVSRAGRNTAAGAGRSSNMPASRQGTASSSSCAVRQRPGDVRRVL